MPHKHGSNIGGAASVEDVRLRCVCDAETDCWHLRTAHGRKQPRDRVHRLWVHGVGHMTATRAVWLLAHGKLPQPHLRVRRSCESYDCVNPEHLECVTKSRHSRSLAHHLTPRRLAVLRATVDKQRKLTGETLQWLLESTQSGAAVAHALGITQSRANALRARARKRAVRAAPSVFAFGAALNQRDYRSAA